MVFSAPVSLATLIDAQTVERRVWPPARSLWAAWLVAALGLAGFLVTLQRVPVVWNDSVAYATIARALQFGQGGVPTALRDSPTAVDHIPFYGPIFFQLAAWAYAVFGFSIASFRLISLLGGVLITVAAWGLVRAYGGHYPRQAWIAAALMLSPEVGSSATSGRMDSLAVGLGLLALTLTVRGIARGTQPWRYGAEAGVLIASAALTTPRAYPMVGAFFAGVIVLLWSPPQQRRAAAHQMIATTAIFLVIFTIWTIAAHGGPIRWLRYMAFIAMRENTDVALLMRRQWAFESWRLITPVAAGIGLGLAMADYRHASARGEDWTTRSYPIAVTWMTLTAGVTVLNGTFFFEIYWALPLLVAVLAVTRSTPRTRALFALMLLVFAGERVVKYVRVGATWQARDPALIEAFVKTHVPAGADVIGPEDFYFFAVERSGARYLFAYPESWATWARWVPQFDPAMVHAPRPVSHAERYLIWPVPYYTIPAQYACAIVGPVATYNPPPIVNVGVFEPGATTLAAYPTTVLYRLQATCPPPS